MTSTISTQPASNFFALLTDHTIPGLSTLLPTSATCIVPYHLLKYLQGIACISTPDTPNQMTTPTLFFLVSHDIGVCQAWTPWSNSILAVHDDILCPIPLIVLLHLPLPILHHFCHSFFLFLTFTIKNDQKNLLSAYIINPYFFPKSYMHKI